MKREDFVSNARSMIGTPFHHQGRVPGVGLDCAGLVICAASELDLGDKAGYGRIPSQGLFSQAVADQCDPVSLDVAVPGDIIMFAFRTEPQHVAIISSINPVMIIHAFKDAGRVVENSLDATWLGRLRGVWRIRGLA